MYGTPLAHISLDMSTSPLVLLVAAIALAASGPVVSAQGPVQGPPGRGQKPPTQGPPVQPGRGSQPIILTPPSPSAPAPLRAGGADLEEVTVKADAVIGIRLETTLDSERAKLEDPVVAKVTRDVTVKDRTAIPAGARLEGYVSSISRGSTGGKPGSDRGQARIGLKFTTLVLNDGKLRLPIETETVFRSAESTASQALTRVGAGAVVGSILGAAIGGRKGAIIGGSAGAAGGAAATAASDRSDVTIPTGTTLTVRLTEPLTVLVERTPFTR
jgi:hypothetical protein